MKILWEIDREHVAVVILSRTINTDNKDFGKLIWIKTLGNTPIFSECVENFISVYNTDPLKTQEKADSYLKGKTEACKIVLVIHMTIKSEVQLEFSKSSFVIFTEKLWLCMRYLEQYYLLCAWFYLETATFDADQEHIQEVPGNILLNFRVSSIRVSGCWGERDCLNASIKLKS